eukprot:928460-Prorocentrum_minimum.AAC.3
MNLANPFALLDAANRKATADAGSSSKKKRSKKKSNAASGERCFPSRSQSPLSSRNYQAFVILCILCDLVDIINISLCCPGSVNALFRLRILGKGWCCFSVALLTQYLPCPSC